MLNPSRERTVVPARPHWQPCGPLSLTSCSHPLPPQSTSYLQPCDVAVFRSFKSCIQTQANATLARAVLDSSFDGLAMNKAWRRPSHRPSGHRAQSRTSWPRTRAWSTGWRQLRAHDDGAFRDAVEEATALHSRDDLFAKHNVPEPAPEDLLDWAMAEATDNEDDAPMPDAPPPEPETEFIDMPPAPASAPRMSNLGAVHRSATRVRRWTTMSLVKKNHNHHHITSSLSVVSRVCSLVPVLCVLPRIS